MDFLRDESGATAAEYAFILAIIGTSLVVAAIAFGEAMGGALGAAGSAITDVG